MTAFDTNAFRQTRVMRYGRRFWPTKILSSVFSLIFKTPSLPKIGQAFREASITDYAVKNRDPKILEALLIKIHNDYREKKYQSINFGSSIDDPLLSATDKFFFESVNSHIVLSAKDKDLLEKTAKHVNLPYIDISLL